MSKSDVGPLLLDKLKEMTFSQGAILTRIHLEDGTSRMTCSTDITSDIKELEPFALRNYLEKTLQHHHIHTALRENCQIKGPTIHPRQFFLRGLPAHSKLYQFYIPIYYESQLH